MTDAPTNPAQPISLADVVARNLALDWYEAVAIVRALCDALQARAAADRPAPELGDVLIEPSGTVLVCGDARPDESLVSRIGSILSALFASNQAPPPLRLVVLSAVSPSPLYGSIEEFSEALAYFERPGRNELIRGVHRRCHEIVPPRMSGAEGRKAVTPDSGVWTRRIWRYRKPLAAGVVTALAAGTVALWLSTSPRHVVLLSSVWNRIPRVTARTTRAAATFVSAATARIRQRLVGAPVAPQIAQSGRSSTPVSRPRNAANRPPELNLPAEPRSSMAPLATWAPAPPEEKPDSGIPTIERIEPGPGRRPLASVQQSDSVVYSESDADVIPPIPIRANFPTSLPSGYRVDDPIVLELLVDEHGEVQSVRLLAPTGRVQEGMMLSAAKAWRFKAATKDAEPVKYLKRVLLPNR